MQARLSHQVIEFTDFDNNPRLIIYFWTAGISSLRALSMAMARYRWILHIEPVHRMDNCTELWPPGPTNLCGFTPMEQTMRSAIIACKLAFSGMVFHEADASSRFSAKIMGRKSRAKSPPRMPLAELREEASRCKRCDLYKRATQMVFGEGHVHARLLFVGEQPGDREDREGRPFVGPAGALFDRALEEAGIDRKDAYVTNAVKHFKYEPRGKRRLHKRPNAGEIKACKWWLDRELATIQPDVVVALGATAAQSLSGHSVSVLRARGEMDFDGKPGFVTVHPSFLLRIPGADKKDEEFKNFVADLRQIRKMMQRIEAA
jgi:DNA polymerase